MICRSPTSAYNCNPGVVVMASCPCPWAVTLNDQYVLLINKFGARCLFALGVADSCKQLLQLFLDSTPYRRTNEPFWPQKTTFEVGPSRGS
jgi:hypothetical protein